MQKTQDVVHNKLKEFPSYLFQVSFVTLMLKWFYDGSLLSCDSSSSHDGIRIPHKTVVPCTPPSLAFESPQNAVVMESVLGVKGYGTTRRLRTCTIV